MLCRLAHRAWGGVWIWGLSVSVAHAQDLDLSDARDAVVVVQQADGACAGTHVGDGWILTARHCATGLGGVRLTWRDGATQRARKVAWLPSLDLMWLRAEGGAPGRAAVGVASGPVGLDEAVQVIGHPLGTPAPYGFLQGMLRWSARPASIAASGPFALQVSAPLYPGDSGGPVLTASGEVGGVVSRKLPGGPAFAAQAHLAEPLRTAAASGDARRPAFGGSLWLWPEVVVPTAVAERTVVGVRLAVAWHDRLLTGVQVGVPVGEAPDAGQPARDAVAGAHVGWTQPLGHGASVPWIRAVGGMHVLRGAAGATAWAPSVGGGIRWRSVLVQAEAMPVPEVGWRPRLTVGVVWPGAIARF